MVLVTVAYIPRGQSNGFQNGRLAMLIPEYFTAAPFGVYKSTRPIRMKPDFKLVVHTDIIPIDVRIAIIQQKLDRVREHRNLLIQAHTIRVAECTLYLENLISQIEILRREVGAPKCNKDTSSKSRESFWRNLFRRFF